MPRKSSVFLPVFLGVSLLLGAAGFVAWQAGVLPEAAIAGAQDALHDAFSNPSTAPTPQRVLETGPALQPEQELPARKPSPLAPLAIGGDSPEPSAAGTMPAQLSGQLQDLWVSTNPPGAKVVLDDRLDQSCQTPCMLHSPAGVHHLTVSQAGYMNEYREVHVGNTAQDIPVITLRQPGAALMVSSDPPGATVRINGEMQDQATPASINLRPGTYSVTVEKGGRSQTQRVEIRDSPVLLRVPLGQ